MSNEGKREGSLEAPTRHPLEWRTDTFYDEAALFEDPAIRKDRACRASLAAMTRQREPVGVDQIRVSFEQRGLGRLQSTAHLVVE